LQGKPASVVVPALDKNLAEDNFSLLVRLEFNPEVTLRRLLISRPPFPKRFPFAGVAAALILMALAASQAGAQGFQVAPTIAIASGVSAVAVADVNGDGNPDMVVVGGSVNVFLGNGDGTFQAPISYAIAGSSIAIADLNGDGKPDLVVGTSTGVAILLGMGNGKFQTAFTYTVAAGQVVIGDFNGDGKLDVITSGGTVLLGKGNGTFQLGPRFSPTGSSVAAGDFNGDGKLDLVVNDGLGNLTVLTGNGNGTFQADRANGFFDVYPSAGIAVADFNNDGRLDLAVSIGGDQSSLDPETSVSVLLGNGGGGFTSAASVGFDQFFGGSTTIATGDFNGDGKPDLVVTRPEGLVVYLGNGDGTFQPPVLWGAPSPTGVPVVGDFDKNGKLDLVEITSNGVAILLGNGDGTFQAESGYPTGFVSAVPVGIVTGDFNNDGKEDLEMVSDVEFEGITPLESLLGNGNGTFQYFTAFGSTAGFVVSGEAAGDLNRDGNDDLVIADCNDGPTIYLGNGNGTFQGAVGDSNPSLSVAVADINGDGKLDIVSVSGTTLDVMLGNGDGTFQPTVSYPCEGNCNFVRLGDFNGDGQGDAAVGNMSSNNISIFMGNGGGTFKPAVNYSVGNGPICITFGDFTGDGIVDLAVATADGVYLLAGNGDGTFQNGVLIGPPSLQVAALDFNGDGKFDFLTANVTGGISLYSGNGNGTFELFATYEANAPNGFEALRVGDFNNDGAPDFVAGNAFFGTFTVFMNERGTKASVTSSANPSSFDQPVTFTAQVSASVAGSGSPMGTVTFMDSSIVLGTETLESGEASITVSNLAAGTHTISVAYAGDGKFNPHMTAPLIQRVTQAGTSTALVSSVNPSAPGQAVTFTATVTPLTSGIATGSVTFKDGAAALGTVTLNGSGQAQLTTSTLKAGTHSIGATYNGSTNYSGSASPQLAQIVAKAATTTVVTSSANPIPSGQSVTFTATVSSSGGVPPNGEIVTFKNGAATLGTGALTGGVATFTTASLAAGTASIKATYAGDTTFLASTSAIFTETVNKYTTAATVTSSANPSSFGQSVTFSTAVTSSSGGTSGGTPTGTVTFKNGTATLGTQNLAGGAATLATSALTVGTHSITVVYNGDASHAASTSPAVSQVVNKTGTSTVLSSSQNPSTTGQSVTFSATVTATTSGVPTGSVTFKSGTRALGAETLVGGVASISTTTLAKGSDTISASYSGSPNFVGSSTTLIQVVN
jgi:hypothetical protein